MNNYMERFKKYYYTIEYPKIRKRIHEFREEMGNEGKCIRLSYLYDKLYEIEDEIIYRTKTRFRLFQSGTKESLQFVSRPLPGLRKKMARLEAGIEAIMNPLKDEKDRITSDMIERARDYPMTELIEFKKNFALCPFHIEKTPSFHLDRQRNFAYCFGCKEAADSIKVYMQLNGTNFIETVRILQ